MLDYNMVFRKDVPVQLLLKSADPDRVKFEALKQHFGVETPNATILRECIRKTHADLIGT